MIKYKYKAIDKSYAAIEGVISASSEQEAVKMIREKGLTPVNVGKDRGFELSLKGLSNLELTPPKVKLVDLAVFCRQMSIMLRVGMSLDKAVNIQIKQTENRTMREALEKIESQVRQGIPFSKNMSEFPEIFPPILYKMVETGEGTGNIDGALERMAVHFEKENAITRRIKGAMIYPIILALLTFVISTGMIIFIIPTFTELFASAGQSLPALTQFFVSLSDAMLSRWYFFVVGIVGIVFGIKYTLKTERGRYIFDDLKLKIPVTKQPMQQVITARFTRTLSTLISSGITLLYSVEFAGSTANNTVVEKAVNNAAQDLKRGAVLSDQLEKTGLFPEMMVSMIRIGEETGALDSMLQKTANYYDEEFDAAISRLLALMEPLMIIVMGGIVGTIVIAMYLPMFTMYDAL